MNNLTESKASAGVSNIARKLCAYKLKSDYDIKMSVEKEGSSGSPECSHSFKGSSEHSIVKLVALAAAISLSACAISSVCSLICRFSKH